MGKTLAIALLAALGTFSTSTTAKVLVDGSLTVLPKCPGDGPPSSRGTESAVMPLLTPIITGVVSHGIKAFGTALQEAAKPKEVDALHEGGYYYRAAGNEASANVGCIIVATKGARSSGRNLDELVSAYTSVVLPDNANSTDYADREITPHDRDPELTARQRLKELLIGQGYGVGKLPALLAVIEVRNDWTTKTARFLPRYVYMDHSLRERSAEGNSRNFNLQLTITSPDVAQAITSQVVVFKDLDVSKPRRRREKADADSLRTSGQWFSLPAVNQSVKDRLSAIEANTLVVDSETTTTELARAKVEALGGQVHAVPPSGPEALSELKDAMKALAGENLKPEASRDAKTVARLLNTITFYESCIKLADAREKLVKLNFKPGEQLLPFDLSVSVVEHRRRPIVEFLGNVFTDPAVNSGMTTAIVNEIDPATRRLLADKESAEDAAAMVAYEAALLEARKATLDYGQADDASRESKALEMEFKCRAANRLAEQLGISRPFPASGVRP